MECVIVLLLTACTNFVAVTFLVCRNVFARDILTRWALKLGVDLEEVMGRELPLVELEHTTKKAISFFQSQNILFILF